MRAWRFWKQGSILALVLTLVFVVGAAQITIPLPTKTEAGAEALDFGAVPVGTTRTAQYTLKVLEGSATSGTVTRLELPSPPFSAANVPGLGTVIPPGGSVVITFSFTPPAVGTYTGAFTAEITGGYPPQTHRKTVVLTGQGVTIGEQPGTVDTEIVDLSLTGTEPPITVTLPPTITEDTAKLEAKLDMVEIVLEEFRQKLDNLAAILGEWIVGRGQRFYIEPGMTAYNPTAPSEGIKPEIETLEQKVDDVLSALDGLGFAEGVLQPPPVQVTSASGNRFRDFLALADLLLVRTAEDVLAINPEDTYTQEILASYADFVLAGREEVSELITLSQAIPSETQAVLDYAVVDGAPELLDVITSGSSRTPKFQVELDGGGNEVVGTILEKAGSLLSSVPILGGLFNAVLDDAAKLFEGNSELAELVSGMALAQLELELKLDAIVRGLFGVSIDEAMDETALRERLRQVTLGDIPQRFERLREDLDELRQKLDNLGFWLGKLTVGYGIGIEPDSTNPMPETDLWTLLAALEAKLDRAEVKLDGLQQTLDDLQQALDDLGDWLDGQFAWVDEMFAWLHGEVLGAIDVVQAGVNANGAAIAANANAIANVQAGVNANGAAIAANADAIAAVQDDIGTLQQGLDDLEDLLYDEFDWIDQMHNDILDSIDDVQNDVVANGVAIAANANAIAGVHAAVNVNNAAIAANTNVIAALQAQVNNNGQAIAALSTMVRNLVDSNNRLEDKVNRLLGLPAAPDKSKMTLREGTLDGEAGAVEPSVLVTVYGPMGDQTSVTAGPDGSFFVEAPPSAVNQGFAEVTQTDAQGNESARVVVYASP